MPRSLPNILITGTPGVGKTTLASEIASSSADQDPAATLTHIPVNEIIKTRSCHEGYDDRLKTHIVDEDKLLDELEKDIFDGDEPGGFILDYHVPDIFPDRWIDLVVVLRCSDTQVFYERLAGGENNGEGTSTTTKTTGRGYEGDKLQENIDAEIFGVIKEEAVEGYPGEGRVVELESVTAEDMEGNCERVLEWVKNWLENKKDGGD